jgi:5-methylcytosine-specific restriction endonuclease McrA
VIRYPVTEDELIALVNALDSSWLADAEARLMAFALAGCYDEKAGNWSKIKDAYIGLQQRKCAYCERKRSGPPEGRIEHDVEHYRPKSEVKSWPTAAIIKKRNLTYRFATGDSMPSGYYLLSYRLLNYATACKTCNSSFKSSYFPIAGQRGKLSDKPADYKSEGPFIPYPLGTFDDDPETIITFEGIVPVPKARSRRSMRYRRAQITIDFFRLDLREELLEGRARVLDALWIFLEQADHGSTEEDRIYAQESVDLCTGLDSPHASCARAFAELYKADHARAKRYFEEAHKYLLSKRHPVY